MTVADSSANIKPSRVRIVLSPNQNKPCAAVAFNHRILPEEVRDLRLESTGPEPRTFVDRNAPYASTRLHLLR